MEILSRTSFIIWHGGAESQGIALQEAMACDVPILLCDVTSLSQTRGGYTFDECLYHFPVTAAPYFDEMCGIRIRDFKDLRQAIEQIIDMRDQFRPREYVLKNLSLEKQAREFVRLWEEWSLDYASGLKERITTTKKWNGPSLFQRLSWRVRRELAAFTFRRYSG
jgi:glycosyltransferase involved in cell wall biosynthesis